MDYHDVLIHSNPNILATELETVEALVAMLCCLLYIN